MSFEQERRRQDNEEDDLVAAQMLPIVPERSTHFLNLTDLPQELLMGADCYAEPSTCEGSVPSHGHKRDKTDKKRKLGKFVQFSK